MHTGFGLAGYSLSVRYITYELGSHRTVPHRPKGATLLHTGRYFTAYGGTLEPPNRLDRNRARTTRPPAARTHPRAPEPHPYMPLFTLLCTARQRCCTPAAAIAHDQAAAALRALPTSQAVCKRAPEAPARLHHLRRDGLALLLLLLLLLPHERSPLLDHLRLVDQVLEWPRAGRGRHRRRLHRRCAGPHDRRCHVMAVSAATDRSAQSVRRRGLGRRISSPVTEILICTMRSDIVVPNRPKGKPSGGNLRATYGDPQGRQESPPFLEGCHP